LSPGQTAAGLLLFHFKKYRAFEASWLPLGLLWLKKVVNAWQAGNFGANDHWVPWQIDHPAH
jgi:hypothetical protein